MGQIIEQGSGTRSKELNGEAAPVQTRKRHPFKTDRNYLTMIYEKSCGAIIFSEKDGKRYYLIEQMLQGHHSICKGHMEGDETERQTATREIMEETGLSVEFVDGFRECIEYSPYKNCIKNVVFFLARAIGTDVTAQKEEVKDIIWLVFDDAMTTLTFDSDKETLQKAEGFLQNACAITYVEKRI